MKIAVVVFLFGGASGGIKAANTIASQLADAGHEVSILTCEDVKKTFFDVNKNVYLRTIGKIHFEDNKLLKEDREYIFGTIEERFKVIRAKHKYSEDMLYRDLVSLDPDCVVSVLFQTHFFSIPAALRAGIPVIASEHNSPKSYKEYWWMTKDELEYLYYLLKSTHRIHILSKKYIEGYPEYLHHKMVEIGNSVDIKDEKNYKREKYIVAVGELSKWKNYEILIDSFLSLSADFPDWTLRIFGEGPEKGNLLKKINENPQIGNSIQLMGIVPHSDILVELDKSKIFCHPSLAESFGLAVAEGLAAGLPAIGLSDTDGVNSLISDGYNGYLIPSSNTIEEMSLALRRLMNDSSLLERLSINARESVLNFSSKSVSKQWNDVIEWLFKPARYRKLNNRANPLVSVITISLGNDKNTLKTLESLWKQTYDNIELIVLDLNNNDKNEQLIPIIKENMDKIDIYHFYSNDNVIGAINKGIELASGDIIYTIDNSYLLDEFAIERAVFAIVNQQKDIVVGSLVIGNSEQKTVSYAENLDISTVWTGLSMDYNIFASKEAFESIGFYNSHLNYNSAKMKWFLDGYFSGFCILYDNSILINTSEREFYNQDAIFTKVILMEYFNLIENIDIEFIHELINRKSEEPISNGDLEKLLTILRANVNNKDFVYSIIKCLALRATSNTSLVGMFNFNVSTENSNIALNEIYSIKEFLKYKLRGTIIFKPAKYVYSLIKKLK